MRRVTYEPREASVSHCSRPSPEVTLHSSRVGELHISRLLPNALSHVIPKSDVRLGSWSSPSAFIAVNVTPTPCCHRTAEVHETAYSERIGREGASVGLRRGIQESLDVACDLNMSVKPFRTSVAIIRPALTTHQDGDPENAAGRMHEVLFECSIKHASLRAWYVTYTAGSKVDKHE